MSAKEREADLSPALLGCGSGGEDGHVHGPQGECVVTRKTQALCGHRGGHLSRWGAGLAVREGGRVHVYLQVLEEVVAGGFPRKQ